MGEFASYTIFDGQCRYLIYPFPQSKLEQFVDVLFLLAPLTSIQLSPTLVFEESDEVLQSVFTAPDTLHRAYMPSRVQLVDWVKRIKLPHPKLANFKLGIGWNVVEDIDCDMEATDDELLTFAYSEPTEDDDIASPECKMTELKDDLFKYTVDTDLLKYVHQVLEDAWRLAQEEDWEDSSDSNGSSE